MKEENLVYDFRGFQNIKSEENWEMVARFAWCLRVILTRAALEKGAGKNLG